MKILLIEDDPEIGRLLKVTLEQECYVVDHEEDGYAGYRLAREYHYDLIILASVLPGMRGIEICKALRDGGASVPILVLSGEFETQGRVDILHTGADDCVAKPFSFAELSARVKALLRRPVQLAAAVLQVDDLILDRAAFAVSRGCRAIYLTAKEYELLEYLMRNRGRVVSRTMLMEHVWDRNADLFSRTIETHVMRLRRKIDAHSPRKLIHTIPGRGYKLDLTR